MPYQPTTLTRARSVNTSTGEVSDHIYSMPVRLDDRLDYPGGFRKTGKEVDQMLVAPKISATRYQLYHYLNLNQSKKEPGRVIVGSQRKIAADLQASQPAVCKAFAQLRAFDLIYQIELRVWQINPMYGINAGGKAQREAIAEVPPEIAERVWRRRRANARGEDLPWAA